MIPVETSVRYGQGSLATHVSVQVENLAAIPASIDASLSSEEAAGLPLVSTTALHLVRKARAGNKVLVLGGSTSVGLILLQMLKAEGAGHIVATASGVKKDTVKARGADEIIDYREEDVVQTLRRNHSRKQFDVILDTVGDFAVFGACAAYLKESGEYANVGASDMKPDGSIWSSLSFLRNLGSLYLPWWLGGVPRKSSWGEFVRGAMPEVTDRYLVTNIVTCPIDSTFTFDDAPKAYERLMTDDDKDDDDSFDDRSISDDGGGLADGSSDGSSSASSGDSADGLAEALSGGSSDDKSSDSSTNSSSDAQGPVSGR
ncbi:hypothetical protein PHSY_003671 [Pseudozyma hubeiensis SY62]|uniref:Alcohol dehydrogenase-like C-terminal domain-containing protein n=1 Tax=Pseudozyma hubeiensis (strain SY62) TaxID=1305764 RepID=R9P4B0_PSEHS|nr:hypothetical protein PHSY_003671 [Pseudozyma hubeiensis SY62]GAC96092.1 hypothetical protein PHSY_003671 [Pseudozyma hubeiensis SY62]